MVKGVLDIHQLHLQLVLGDALDGDVKRLLLVFLVALLDEHVLLGRDAQNGLERRADVLVRHLDDAGHALAQLHAAGGLGHNVHTVVQIQSRRIKVIQLAGALEAHPDYHGHWVYSSDILSSTDSNAEANATLLAIIMRALVTQAASCSPPASGTVRA